MAITAKTITSVIIEAKVIRVDGTVEDLGTICHYHRNPLDRVAYQANKTLKGVKSWLLKL